jgi:hypothetical protein
MNMPAMGAAPPTFRGIVFVLFVMFLLVAIPIGIAIWLVIFLPWQFSAGVVAGMVLMYFTRRRKHD